VLQPSGARWTARRAARRAGAAAPVNAGAFGYHLHRQLVALGVRNLVGQPQDWNERGKGVKTDRIEPVEAGERQLTEAIQEAARDRKIPKGVGPLSFEVLRREVGDWSRFNNRREVSSCCFAPPHGAHPCGAACGWLSRSARLRTVPA
jgi:hypothetical protein